MGVFPLTELFGVQRTSLDLKQNSHANWDMSMCYARDICHIRDMTYLSVRRARTISSLDGGVKSRVRTLELTSDKRLWLIADTR